MEFTEVYVLKLCFIAAIFLLTCAASPARAIMLFKFALPSRVSSFHFIGAVTGAATRKYAWLLLAFAVSLSFSKMPAM